MKDSVSVFDQPQPQQLAEALVALPDVPIMRAFLRDVMTEKEIIEISARLEAARLLSQGANYAEVIAQTKLSSRTVARISDWLKNGNGGYAAALNTLHHQPNTPAGKRLR